MSEPSFDPYPISLQRFSLWAGNLPLLDAVNLELPAGKLSVIVGPSGAGKSTLLKALGRLTSPNDPSCRWTGDLLIGNQTSNPRIGLVFQSFALFDELSPLANIQLALDHFRPANQSMRTAGMDARQWLDRLGVPAVRYVSQLSGGQKQRLAIARTLASHPEILLYDEPTSGLDPATAKQVAELVRKTQQDFGITSVVVTHDYASWLGVADSLFHFDSSQKSIAEISVNSTEAIEEKFSSVQAQKRLPTDNEKQSKLKWLATGLGRFLDVTADSGKALVTYPLTLIPRWSDWRWGVRFTLHYLRIVAGPSAWIYIAIAGLIAGFVSTYFTFRFLPFAVYTKPLLLEELLAAIGFSLYRVLVPVLATILIAARSGAAVAADVAGKTYGGQIAAMQTIGVKPNRYIQTPIAFAFLLGTPLLTMVAFVVARWASLVVFSTTQPNLGPFFWDSYFHQQLKTDDWFFQGTNWWLLKTILCGALIGMVAHHHGRTPKFSSRDVSRAITSTVLWATLAVLMVHFAVAFFEFEPTNN